MLQPIRRLALLAVGLPLGAAAPDAAAQARTEQVGYWNREDSTFLTASLTLPAGPGPHAGVVLLSIAGVDPLVTRLAELGYATLVPIRRGFVAVEPLLQATYEDLAEDAQAAVDYLRDRPDVADARLSMIGQGDDAPAAMLAAATATDPIPLVLLAPPGFPGREVFRLEQGGMAERRSFRPGDREAVERLADQIAGIVLAERSAYLRALRLEELMLATEVRLPYNAAFPTDDGQIHFFASPLWHDRLAFEPEGVLARLRGPVLVLIGLEDPDTPLDAYLAAIGRGLARAPTSERMVCVLPDRTRHSYTPEMIEVVAAWLGRRAAPSCERPPGAPRR